MLPALLLLSCTTPEAPPPPAGTVDAILIVVDTLRRDHTSAYGHDRETTPRLAALAAEGVRYDRAVSAAPWTLPSMAAMLTGQLPSALGVTRHDSRLPDDARLLSAALSEAGWATGAVSSHSFFSPEHGFDRGFSSFDTGNIRGHRAETSAGVTDAAIRFLRDHPSEPVFLVVHYFDPHFAYIDHPETSFADPAYAGPVKSGAPIAALREQAPTLGAADWDALGRLYDAEIAHTDRHIGRLLDAIAAEGRAERALVAVTHDHGESFYEHGHLGHTTELYGALVDAPLVVRYPSAVGPTPGTTVPEPVSLMDLPRTVSEVLGVSADFPGESLLHPAAGRVVRSETQKGADLRAVVDDRHRLIWDRSADTWHLYDTTADPGDTTDLSAVRPEAVAALRPHLKRWVAAGAGAGATLSPESLERLRVLGYTGD